MSLNQASNRTAAMQTIRVWDPLVRLFHWSLVASFAIAYLTEGEDDWMTLHSYAGYTALGLLAFRLLWGFIGSYHARFVNFITGPAEAIAYLKGLKAGKVKDYLGHNPAGAAMIVALFLSLVATGFSGMVVYGIEGHGPLAGTFVAGWSEDMFEEVHEFFANFTLALVVLHVAGVVVSSRLHGENLVRAMLTGNKQRPMGTPDEKH